MLPRKTRILGAWHLRLLPGASWHRIGVPKEVLEGSPYWDLSDPQVPIPALSKEDLAHCLIFRDLGFRRQTRDNHEMDFPPK